MGRVQAAVADADPDRKTSISEAAGEAGAAAEQAKEATAAIGERAGAVAHQIQDSAETRQIVATAAETMEKAEDTKKEEKVALLEQVNRLREERTVLVDRLNAVLGELESKTDQEDTETLGKLKDYRLYIKSLQGIRVDVKDTTSTWIAIKGWLMSQEGGLRWAKNIALFGDDINKAQAILEEIVAAHPKVLKDPPPTIRMNTLADSSVNFICRPWARTAALAPIGRAPRCWRGLRRGWRSCRESVARCVKRVVPARRQPWR